MASSAFSKPLHYPHVRRDHTVVDDYFGVKVADLYRAESKKDLLESAHAVNGNQLLLRYLSVVKHVPEVRDLEIGSLLHRLPIDIGSVDGIIARRGDSVVFFKFTSILTPGIVYQCDLKNDRSYKVEDLQRKCYHRF
ncbi:hypothetical protein RND81_12G133000 [Saponaria officinalis]|uniref:Peptidase S9A N-terminal domain-containing protein n=1 Tax=Saponaria officinalis TaxID=3572 RepID=A0AAW1HA26_SAPOF